MLGPKLNIFEKLKMDFLVLKQIRHKDAHSSQKNAKFRQFAHHILNAHVQHKINWEGNNIIEF